MADPASEPVRGSVNPLFVFAAAIVVIAGLKAFGDLLGPLFLALVLVVTVSPISSFLRRRGLPQWMATIVTLLSVYAILIGLVGALVYAVSQLVIVLPTYGDQFNALIAEASRLLGTFGIGPAQIQQALDAFDLGSVVGFLQGLLGQVAGLLSNLVLILSVLLFMVADAASFPERLVSIGRSRPHIVDALTAFSQGTRRYLAVTTVFGLIIATLDVVVLLVLGVPLALLFGLVSFIANFIPNVGFVIALVPPAILALLEGGPGLMIAVIAAFLVINVVLQTIVQPNFVGDAVGLSVTVTFLALVFWGWVVGPLGALLAIPLTLLAKALLVDADPRTRWLGALISDKTRPTD